jgi:hypothetical protein
MTVSACVTVRHRRSPYPTCASFTLKSTFAQVATGKFTRLKKSGHPACISTRMKKFLIPCLAFGLITALPLRADDTPLAKAMEVIDDAYKAMRKTKDAAEGVKLARQAQEEVLKAIAMTPAFIEKGSHPAGKEKAMVSYKKQMAQTYVVFCEMEDAFLAKDFDKVQELVAALKEAKKQGHNEFMDDEE